jgi:hypothetical protein
VGKKQVPRDGCQGLGAGREQKAVSRRQSAVGSEENEENNSEFIFTIQNCPSPLAPLFTDSTTQWTNHSIRKEIPHA